MTIDAIVINLESSTERREFQEIQLDDLGITMHILNAVTVAGIDAHKAGITFNAWERPLLSTEKSCFLSHYNAWREVIARGKPTLILEDDALLSSRTPNFLLAIEGLAQVEHVTLETRARKKLIAKRHIDVGIGCIAPLIQDRTGAAAYVLWPAGARKLCEKAEREGGCLADAFISNFCGLLSFQSLPAFAIQSDRAKWYGITCILKTYSYIQQSTQTGQTSVQGKEWWRYKKIRVKSQIRQALKYIFHFCSSSRTLIHLDTSGYTNSRDSKGET